MNAEQGGVAPRFGTGEVFITGIYVSTLSDYRIFESMEGVECLLADDVEIGAAVLQGNINATIGFEEMYYVFNNSDKSLMRMFGPKGTPPRRAACLR